MTLPAASGAQGRQLARVNLLTGTFDRISEPITRKINSVGVINLSGQLAGAYVFYALLDNERIHVYVSRPGNPPPPSGPDHVIMAPVPFRSQNTLLVDEENFFFGGEPYITFTMGSTDTNPALTSEIWFVHAFATLNVHYRRVSLDDEFQRRNDPEPYVVPNLPGGPDAYLYYREMRNPMDPLGWHNFRLRRAATGLRDFPFENLPNWKARVAGLLAP
jgi:hypothetical protein